MAGKQAKTFSAEALSQLLAFAARTRQPARNDKIHVTDFGGFDGAARLG